MTSSINVLGSVTPTELARTLGLSPTTLSAMIERLVQKGEVRRTRHPRRRPVLRARADGPGEGDAGGDRPRFGKTIGEVRGHLDGEPEEVLAALRRLEDALRATIAGP